MIRYEMLNEMLTMLTSEDKGAGKGKFKGDSAPLASTELQQDHIKALIASCMV